MNFCSHCGKPVVERIPEGDNRLRHVCDHCDTIHYMNPRIIAGCLVTHKNKILLCKRAIEPRYGLWTLPAGFMENGESSLEAARRETWEEAKAKVDIQGIYSVFNLPHINQVYMIFRSTLRDSSFAAGTESLDVALFNEDEIPWDNLAFSVMRKTLEFYCKDRKQGDFPFRLQDLHPRKSRR
jgi:ADP-ribose pyrophosphatase YjhB (NUDIX family)